ncbi:hypothetical protein EIP91_004908 [Steccherinum ochraceum]|uniref:BTB domain-containing protein n=1 Tax=Steccherinum ochraceum TaxID=92696 RepID=A0A4R0RAY9_9APHY|nr:hypothetical protein EIP91_004908 [Steccherinum ochraceum]
MAGRLVGQRNAVLYNLSDGVTFSHTVSSPALRAEVTILSTYGGDVSLTVFPYIDGLEELAEEPMKGPAETAYYHAIIPQDEWKLIFNVTEQTVAWGLLEIAFSGAAPRLTFQSLIEAERFVEVMSSQSVLAALEHKKYRLHSGVLAHRSEFFHGMFSLAPNADSVRGLEGLSEELPIILCGATPKEFDSLLHFIYGRHWSRGYKFSSNDLVAILRLSNMWGIPSGRSFAVSKLDYQVDLKYPRLLRLACDEKVSEWFTGSFFGTAGIVFEESIFRELGYESYPPPWYRVERSITSPLVIATLGPYWTLFFVRLMQDRLAKRISLALASLKETYLLCPEHCRERCRSVLFHALSKLVGFPCWLVDDQTYMKAIRSENRKRSAVCQDCLTSVLAQMREGGQFAEERNLAVRWERFAWDQQGFPPSTQKETEVDVDASAASEF